MSEGDQLFGGAGAVSSDMYHKLLEASKRQRSVVALTISDAERLAKAGIQINFNDIAPRLMPDPSPKERGFYSALTDRLLERYLPTWRAKVPFGDLGAAIPFQFLATEHGDKVHVYVAPLDGRDPVVLVDEKVIFPSDKLIASINLMDKCK